MYKRQIRGWPKQLAAPVDDIERLWNPVEASQVQRMTRCSAVGGPDTFRKQIESLLEETQADELIATAHIHDQQARLRSFEIAADVFKDLQRSRS